MTKQKKKSNLNDMTYKTLQELVNFLSGIDGKVAAKLQITLMKTSPHQIVKLLKDSTSDLYNSIPVDILGKDEIGLKYLTTLAIIQPDFNRIPQGTTTTSVTTVTTVETPNANMNNVFKESDDNKLLFDLAHELTRGIELESGEPDLMDMMGHVANSLQAKMESGEMDVKALEQQAMTFLGNMKTMPEMQEVLNNPMFSAFMSSVNTNAE